MQAAVFTTTVAGREQAEELAALLVKERLAACVNVLGPVWSFYEWQGSQQKEEEYKLLIKSWPEKSAAILQFLQSRHPYSVFELLQMPATIVNQPYADWMQLTCPR